MNRKDCCRREDAAGLQYPAWAEVLLQRLADGGGSCREAHVKGNKSLGLEISLPSR